MTLGDRLSDLLQQRKISQNELARRVGVSQQTIWKLKAGESRSSVHLSAIARELGTTAEYLSGHTDDPETTLSASPSDKIVEVQDVDLAYGMGETFLEDDPSGTARRFDRDWLRQFTGALPKKLFFARGIGDSMMPTIHDRDYLLIDRSPQTIDQHDRIWAVAIGGVGMVKRLRLTNSGRVEVLSDNLNVPDYEVGADELHVIGRVVAITRSV